MLQVNHMVTGLCVYVHVCVFMYAGKRALQGFRFIPFGIIKNVLFPRGGGVLSFLLQT